MTLKPDLCIIGGGAAGLSVAAGAAQLGQKVVLIEQNEMGGECLNSGCVPSKALLRAAKAAHDLKSGRRFGLEPNAGKVNFSETMDYVRSVIAIIAPHDSVERFRNLGVTVIEASAQFISPETVQAGSHKISARHFVIASGSKPIIPSIRGLSSVDYLTNETLFSLKSLPQHLLILGGGAMGLEMAQAFRRLGSKVTVIERLTCLAEEDREAISPIMDQLRDEGVTIVENCSVKSVQKTGRKIILKTSQAELTGSHLLLATGRQPNVSGLGLDRAGVSLEDGFVKTDLRLRTTNKSIFAIGDVTRHGGSTHAASDHAGIVIRNALFRLPARIRPAMVPRAVYTSPEYARIGMTETAARAAGHGVIASRWPFTENDRARCEDDQTGIVKVTCLPSGKILGAAICGANAADLLTPWSLALTRKMKLSHIAGLILPYPSRSEASKRAASDFYARKLFSAPTRLLIKVLNLFRH